MKIGPDPYPIPLEVTISKVAPDRIGREDTFILEIEIKNAGRGPFDFPVSRHLSGVEQDENRGRRTALIFIHFEDPPQSELDVTGVSVLAGSRSVSGSLKRLNAGDSVLLRTKVDLHRISELMSSGEHEVTFRAGYSEHTLKDGEFAVENVSEKVTSNNTFTLGVKSE